MRSKSYYIEIISRFINNNDMPIWYKNGSTRICSWNTPEMIYSETSNEYLPKEEYFTFNRETGEYTFSDGTIVIIGFK